MSKAKPPLEYCDMKCENTSLHLDLSTKYRSVCYLTGLALDISRQMPSLSLDVFATGLSPDVLATGVLMTGLALDISRQMPSLSLDVFATGLSPDVLATDVLMIGLALDISRQMPSLSLDVFVTGLSLDVLVTGRSLDVLTTCRSLCYLLLRHFDIERQRPSLFSDILIKVLKARLPTLILATIAGFGGWGLIEQSRGFPTAYYSSLSASRIPRYRGFRFSGGTR